MSVFRFLNLFAYLCIRLKDGQVLHGQLPSNPPGRERSKGSWL